MKKIFGIPYPTVILLIRIFLGLIFFSAGMSKLYVENAFPGLIGPVWLETELTKYGLGLYARFIGWSQIIAGLLLLSQRFATLGAILTFPIILNIFMVTISLKWQGTPYVNFFLILLNAWLLIYDYPKLKFILTDRLEKIKAIPLERENHKADIVWAICIISILLSVLISYFNLYLAWTVCVAAVLTIIINQLKARQKIL